MKRRLPGMVYLLLSKERPNFNTSNVHKIVNKIACPQEQFFKLSPTQLYVLKQLSEYPETIQQKELRQKEMAPKPEKTDDLPKLAFLLMKLPAEMNYLDVEEARDWLKQMNKQQIMKHRANLRLLQSHLLETLNDGSYESHVEHSVRMFIEEIKLAQKKAASQVV